MALWPEEQERDGGKEEWRGRCQLLGLLGHRHGCVGVPLDPWVRLQLGGGHSVPERARLL